MPASSAASHGLSTAAHSLAVRILGVRVAAPALALVGWVRRLVSVVPAEVDTGRRLDPDGAVAEVDRVQVLGEDVLVRPFMGELEGHTGLDQLLEDRPVVLLRADDLDELLRDRGAALVLSAGDVGDRCAHAGRGRRRPAEPQKRLSSTATIA